MKALSAWLAALLLCGCIPGAMGIEIIEPPAPPPEAPVPDRFQGEAAPELVVSEAPGFSHAPSLDPRLYYGAEQRQWYRYALNRWYLAFAWDGNWFPIELDELPKPLRALTPQMKALTTERTQQAEKTREEKLRELDEKLRELEQP